MLWLSRFGQLGLDVRYKTIYPTPHTAVSRPRSNDLCWQRMATSKLAVSEFSRPLPVLGVVVDVLYLALMPPMLRLLALSP